MFNFLNNIGPTELIIVGLILIVFFGGKAITSLARTSGETVKEIKKIKREFTKTIDDDNEPSKN
ncbi:MAG: twin-arginine translocase TatA/TatE family subunit [Patescibacteria group bacterium]